MEYQETELEMLKREISRKDESLARQRLQIEDLLTRNTELTKERDYAVSHIKDVLEQRNLLRVKAASYHDKNLRLNKELGKQYIKVSELEEEIKQLREELDRKDDALHNWDKMVRELEKLKQEVDHRDAAMRAWSDKAEDLSEKLHQRYDQITEMKKANRELEQHRCKQEEAIQDLEEQLAEIKDDRAEIAKYSCKHGETIRTLKKDNRELEEQLKDASEAICELSGVKNDEIDGLKADLEHAMVYLEGHQGREQKLKKIIRDITSDYLDILSDKDRVIEELNQLVKDFG